MRKYILILILCTLNVTIAQAFDGVSWDILIGYAFPVNESYIDTHQNDDIYWNPNSGINIDTRLNFNFNKNLSLIIPLNTNIGYYQYKTTDGRKVNTEAQAGNRPETTNTEWSIAPDLGIMVKAKLGDSSLLPYIAVGISAGLLYSWETWEFQDDNGDDAKLDILKMYDISPVFKGEIGWNIPLKDKVDLKIAATFNLVNYIMKRVELTHYYINGVDRIDEYDEKSTVYNYSYNAPDENKGGDCLLAGFTYNNYPQQKISTNFSLKFGISYK